MSEKQYNQEGRAREAPSVSEICHFLREGLGSFVVQMPQRTRATPEEIWIPGLASWVRTDGSCIHVSHSEPNGGYYYPGRFGRWRLRRAAAEFRRLKDGTDALCERLGLSATLSNSMTDTPNDHR